MSDFGSEEKIQAKQTQSIEYNAPSEYQEGNSFGGNGKINTITSEKKHSIGVSSGLPSLIPVVKNKQNINESIGEEGPIESRSQIG